MGACCSTKKEKKEGLMDDEEERENFNLEEENDTLEGDHGSRVRLRGPSQYTSMFTERGRKGVNQDTMTIWEGFGGEEGQVFCGVFDGHGPSGHKVALQIRDILPAKLSLELNQSNQNGGDQASIPSPNNDIYNAETDYIVDTVNKDDAFHHTFSLWKAGFLKAFQDTDKELSLDSNIDSFYSGTTAVTILRQGEHLMIANLGDSRAVLCSRDNRNHPFPVQLSVDLKPSIPSEAERIRSRKGRVMAMEKEPNVSRVWMPEENCPGLAMARAFGDFCLKDYGLISVPQVSYKKLTSRDEFVVLATDGVWDVLSNREVVKIVASASAKKRSIAAKVLVDHAIHAWRTKYPKSRIDDCAVICLFLKPQSSTSNFSQDVVKEGVTPRALTQSRTVKTTDQSCGFSEVSEPGMSPASTNWSAVEGFSSLITAVNLPRSASDAMTGRKILSMEEEAEKPK
ncbi:probable protein phosphatase 2C 73 [Macadamia integrifolia]|uniref:probable protein phosphatase 2C 73 n=1 Tax=Macadamia integrifolia TaxID=60698 RepID=UPI001C5274D2|nr:probable protein phosphatase 2C 73 [Macadamia integrifolia]